MPEKRQATFKVEEGKTYFPKIDSGSRPFRRVIRIIGGLVFYSIGADKNYHCKLRTFRRAVIRPKEKHGKS